MQQYGLDKGHLQFVAGGRGASKQFYTGWKAGREYMLRFTRCSANRLRQELAEMDFMRYLLQAGLSVAAPLPASSGKLAVLLEDSDKTYVTMACRRLQGKPCDFDDAALWNTNVFQRRGRMMGEMHYAAKGISRQREAKSDLSIRALF